MNSVIRIHKRIAAFGIPFLYGTYRSTTSKGFRYRSSNTNKHIQREELIKKSVSDIITVTRSLVRSFILFVRFAGSSTKCGILPFCQRQIQIIGVAADSYQAIVGLYKDQAESRIYYRW